MSTEKKLAQLRADHAVAHMGIYDWVLSMCESPIEQLFVAALFARDFHANPRHTPAELCARLWFDGNMNCAAEMTDGEITCLIQPRILGVKSRYRVDVSLSSSLAYLAIELDGHDFHERTKAQAAADKSRDRDLVAAGWHVMRFTGSEVYRSPYACAAEAMQHVWRNTPLDVDK